MEANEKLRADKYLWAIRLFKTRALAAEACDKGKVRMDGSPVKAAKTMHVGDELEVRTEARRWLIKVTGLLSNRVQYTEAIKYYIDITPAADENQALQYQPSSFHTGKRQSKIGRPTKKERRDLDNLLDE
ncbi:MAG: RNA-binding S4 domain-containing protein [Williamsia sp.]|nr:RNA-binding S4 domain-containing protein [Williamsia sp.]